MDSYSFVIVDRPQCVYGTDLRAASLTFLDDVDAGYFRYIALADADAEEGPQANIPGLPKAERSEKEKTAHYEAVSIRLAYSQALETLFALLGALVQAPQCPPAWMIRYRSPDLYEFVRHVTNRSLKYWRTPEPPTWKSLAALCLPIRLDDAKGGADRVNKIHDSVGHMWGRFANDFLNDSMRREYNSLKHGSRARPGGFFLSFGLEATPGVPPPEEAMSPLSGSRFGSQYFVAEDIKGEGDTPKYCFQMGRTARNWAPDALGTGLLLLAMSIDNVVARLAVESGRPGGQLQFSWVDDEESLLQPWQHGTSWREMTFHDTVTTEDARPFPTTNEILEAAARK